MSLKTGAEIVIECLIEQGVDTVFGYPGASILHIYDALCRRRGKIKHILTAHEQGAAHAADGYARVTGKTGVCFATSGPGATNLTTGIAAAYMDSSPVVFITCNVSQNLIGSDAFQEADITGITTPITKHNYIVSDVNKLADTIRSAFNIAASGRPGPVLVDIPFNVTIAKCGYETAPIETAKKPSADAADIKRIAELIASSQRPVILAGGGVISSGACAELFELSERICAPVALTMMALGAFPPDHPRYLGMTGIHGTAAATRAVNECDLLIAIGTRFSDRIGKTIEQSARKIIHIDIDRAEINKNLLVECSAVGDARAVLSELLSLIPPRKAESWITNETEAEDLTYSPNGILNLLYKLCGDDTIVVTDVGQHQVWTARGYPIQKPRTLITSGGFGAMGFGLGAAIGAAFGAKGRTILHITGDGSFRMNLIELATVSEYKLPIITVLFDNGVLGLVRQMQRQKLSGRYWATTLGGNPDYTLIAKGYGIEASTADSLDSLQDAVLRAKKSSKPALIRCPINPDETI